MTRLYNLPLARLALLLALPATVLGGCGRGDQPAAAKGQVVARIGNEVVTTPELENEFRLANIPPDKQKDPEILKRVLGELVLRKHLFQQAMAAKLDREPGVLLDLLRAREQVLGNAALTRAAAAKAPSKVDIDRYIARNTWKFNDRKLLNVDQIVVPLNPATQSVLNTGKDARSLDEVVDRLTAAGVPHGRQMGQLMSSDLPQELAELVSKRTDDDIFFTRAGSNGLFFKVRSEEARPIAGDAAISQARQLMRADALAAELGMAAYSAKLEAKFEGDYANLMKQGEGKPQ